MGRGVLTVQPGKTRRSEEPIVGRGAQGARVQGADQLLIAAVWVGRMNMLVREAPARSSQRPGTVSNWSSSFSAPQGPTQP